MVNDPQSYLMMKKKNSIHPDIMFMGTNIIVNFHWSIMNWKNSVFIISYKYVILRMETARSYSHKYMEGISVWYIIRDST